MTDANRELPPAFVQRIKADVTGGVYWLNHLPALLERLCVKWNLMLGAPFPFDYDFVAPATRVDGSEVVLTVIPRATDARAKVDVLKCFNGDGVVRVLDADLVEGAFLTERLRPGTPLSEWFDPTDPDGGRDLDAVRIAAQFMQRMWRPVPATLTSMVSTVAGWLSSAEPPDWYPEPLPTLSDVAAVMVRHGQIRSSDACVLLHGNLSYTNILRDGTASDGWRAANPIGLIGEPGVDIAPLLRSPEGLLDHYNPKWLLRRRIAVLSEVLGMERETVRYWGLVGAVASAQGKVDLGLANGGTAWQSDAEIAELLRTA